MSKAAAKFEWKYKNPENTGRFLVWMECESHMHNCLAFDYPYPCCSVNIMYWNGRTWYSSTNGQDTTSFVKCWSELPEKPEDN